MIASSLFEAASRCIRERDTGQKLQSVQSMAQRWYLGHLIPDGDSCAVERIVQAGVPDHLQLVSPVDVPRRRIGSREGLIALLHAIAHIEYSAINLAVDAVYRFRGMPTQYYDDWIKVATEECYHFAMIRHQLNRLNIDYGDLPAHQGLWDVAMYSADDVLHRMALVPRVLEARGLDVTPGMIHRVEKAGYFEFAEVLKIIFRDEIGHVRIGSFWFNRLCRARSLDPAITFRAYLDRYCDEMNAHISGPFQEDARKLAGFTEQELQQLHHYT